MTLMPKKTKHRKMHKGNRAGVATSATFVDFGEYGMQTLDRGWITAQQIEACRVALTRFFARRGKVWIRIFPDKPVTKKPAETRMGKGKGNVEYWTAAVKRGRVMFEIAGVPRETAVEAFRTASFKLPIKVKLLTREGAGE